MPARAASQTVTRKAKVGSSLAKEKADVLKAGQKVNVEFEDRGGGDVRVKSITGR